MKIGISHSLKLWTNLVPHLYKYVNCYHEIHLKHTHIHTYIQRHIQTHTHTHTHTNYGTCLSSPWSHIALNTSWLLPWLYSALHTYSHFKILRSIDFPSKNPMSRLASTQTCLTRQGLEF